MALPKEVKSKKEKVKNSEEAVQPHSQATIRLLQYRNYSDTTFELGQHTIFIGHNGAGKTNVVEALRTLSVTKSFRVTQDRDAIQWDQPYCRIEYESPDTKLEYILTREEFGTKKAMKLNGAQIPLTQVYGVLPTVLFSPETMTLIDGSPQERRRFLDTILSQADSTYLNSLIHYRKVMKERHFVLLRLQQGLGQPDELDFWDSELVKAGAYIMQQRASCIAALNISIAVIYPHFTEQTNPESLILLYKPSVDPDGLAKKLAQTRGYDIKTGNTNYGPHRDDMIFLLADRDVTLFASRGELRRCVLTTKLAEAEYLKASQSRTPYVLLDDVFSELDEVRRQRFVEAMLEYRTVVTTTDEAFIATQKLPAAIQYHLPHPEANTTK